MKVLVEGAVVEVLGVEVEEEDPEAGVEVLLVEVGVLVVVDVRLLV